MKTSYVFAAPVLMSLCIVPVSASARDHQGEHNSAQHARYEERRHDERFRSEHHRVESREARERREREAQWRTHHNQAARHDRDAFREPAGADHGRKRGWRDQDVPPGQTKKVDYDKDHRR